jgi:hypothetical protein
MSTIVGLTSQHFEIAILLAAVTAYLAWRRKRHIQLIGKKLDQVLADLKRGPDNGPELLLAIRKRA